MYKKGDLWAITIMRHGNHYWFWKHNGVVDPETMIENSKEYVFYV